MYIILVGVAQVPAWYLACSHSVIWSTATSVQAKHGRKKGKQTNGSCLYVPTERIKRIGLVPTNFNGRLVSRPTDRPSLAREVKTGCCF